MNTKEKIEVMQAYLDGKTIMVRDRYSRELEWYDRSINDNTELGWDWEYINYCIKPKPRTVYMIEVSDHSLKLVAWTRSGIEEYDKNPNIIKFVEEIK